MKGENGMARTEHQQLLLFSLILILGISLSLSKAPPVAHSSNSSSYVGAEQCGSCHFDIYEGWNQTNHAYAARLIQNASGNFYSIGSTSNRAGTPSRVYNETSFMAGCRNCHVTGGNNFDPQGAANQTWPNWDTDPAEFLNIQCEVCHGAYQPHGSTNPAMILNYSAALCELCHQPGSSHDNSYWQSAHAQSLADLLASDHAADSCLSCMSTQGALGLTVTLSTTDLASVSCAACHDPHSHEYDAQLRYEESTELCGQCHSQAELFEDSAHSKAGLECTSCHGQGTHLSHGHESAVLNHTWGIYGMHYPYNQTIAEEPIVCSTCHTQSWATSQLAVIQGLTTESITNATEAIEDAKATITIANQTSGVNQTKVDGAMTMVETAEDYISDLERDSSRGFHNPEEASRILIYATRLANAAKATALQAQQEATQSSFDVTSSELSTLKGTTLYLYLGAGLLVGFAVGGVVIYAVKRKS